MLSFASVTLIPIAIHPNFATHSALGKFSYTCTPFSKSKSFKNGSMFLHTSPLTILQVPPYQIKNHFLQINLRPRISTEAYNTYKLRRNSVRKMNTVELSEINPNLHHCYSHHCYSLPSLVF